MAGPAAADEDASGPEKRRDLHRAGPGVEILGNTDLEKPAVVDDADPLSELERLFLVVSHENRRDGERR